MGLWPRNLWPNSVVISPWVFESLGYAMGHQRLDLGLVTSAVWPTANKAFYYPFLVTEAPWTVRRIGVRNGTAVSGNLDVGVYDSEGNRLVSSGSTAQAGTSATQWLDVTDTTLLPGLYYLALALDNVTGTFVRLASLTADQLRSMGVFVQTSAFPLPASATFAVADAAYVPVFFASSRTV